MRLFHRLLPLGVVPLIATACYTFAPVDSPQRGMDVRAQLATEAAVRRSDGLDEPIVNYDGTIVEVTSDTLLLDVLVARSTSLFEDVEFRDTVRLATTEVRSLMERKISPLRTALVGVGAAVGVFAVIKGIDAVVGGTGDDPDPPPPPALVVPVFRWTGLGFVPALLPFRRE